MTATRKPRKKGSGRGGSTRSRSTTSSRGAKSAKTSKRNGATSRSGRSAEVGRRTSDRDRFADRRRSAKRDQSRRRLMVLFALTGLTTLILGVIGMLNSSWFDVDDVQVVGQVEADIDEIVAASGIEPGQPLIEVDLVGAAERIADVPWIGSATVDRAWNGRITIEVVERGPVAAIPARSGFALVDEQGRQLEVVDRRPDGFLPIAGVTTSGRAGDTVGADIGPVLSVVLSLPFGIAEQVAGLRVEPAGVVLDLTTGGEVVLGDDRELGAKYQALETMLTRVDLSCLATMDVRVPSAPTLTRTGDGGTDAADGTGSGPGEEPQSSPVEC